MKLREQFTLDSLIKQRAASLARPDLQNNHGEWTRRAKALAALLECQEKITEIMAPEAVTVQTTNVGDINVNLDGSGGTPGGVRKPYQPFDGGDVGRSVAKQLREELRNI